MSWLVVKIVYVVLTIASAAYSIQQAKKAKDAAKKAADARKGFEIPVEGQAINLPICYGRVKIGGARVFHQTNSNFEFVTPNSDKVFLAGTATTGRRTVTYRGVTVEVTVEPVNTATLLTADRPGKKNQFIYIQQALCQAPISAVIDVIVDDSRFINDATLGTDIYTSADNNLEAAFRVDCFYSGGVADAIMTANFGERSRATFNNMAYASIYAALDRENPQFSGVPQVQFLIEGKLVKTVLRAGSPGSYTYSLNPTLAYSNNPAYCLLDYLLDTVSGKGLDEDELDLGTFYDGAVICDTIVQEDVIVAGKIWKNTDGTRNISTRDLPLYECNLLLDTGKTVRENVETILACMGDARLIWSAGTYKLNMQYPATNEAINLAMTLTDDDLILDQDVKIAWPTASERLNHCIVKFNNEAENFKDDSAAWPPKLGPTAMEDTTIYGLGGFKYSMGTVAKGYDIKNHAAAAYLMNNYASWNGNTPSTTLDYIIIIEKEFAAMPGNFTLEFNADDTGTYLLRDAVTLATISSVSKTSDWRTLYTTTVVSGGAGLGDPLVDKVYLLTLTALDNDEEVSGSKTQGRGVAFRILKGNLNIWNTREPSYTSYVTRTLNNYIYRGDPEVEGDTGLIGEDNGMELETEIYADGISDYYHALAKAEELVRTSRGSFGLEVKYKIRDVILEPGDFIKLESETLNLGIATDIYFRVNSIKTEEGFTATLSLTRFDASFLAWNVKDDIYYRPPVVFEEVIPSPDWLLYTPAAPTILHNSAGTLTWSPVDLHGSFGYVLFMFPDGGEFDAYNRPIWTEIGRTTYDYFILPAIAATHVFFGVKTITPNGRMSDMTVTNVVFADFEGVEIEPVVIYPPWQEEEMILDSTFSLATDKRYWWWDEAYDANFSIVDAGGVGGGVLVVTAAPDLARVFPVRVPLQSIVTGEQIFLSVRYRRTTALPLNMTLTFRAMTVDEDWPDSVLTCITTTPTDLSVSDLSTQNIDEWQEQQLTVTTRNNPANNEQLPYVGFIIYFTDFASGTIEIDTFRAVRIMNPGTIGVDGATEGSVTLPTNSGGLVLSDDGTWVEAGLRIHDRPKMYLRPSDAAASQSFGGLFAMSGDGTTIAITNTNNTEIYIRHGHNFSIEDSFTPGHAIGSVAIDEHGTLVVVGCPAADTHSLTNNGAVFYYYLDPFTDTWEVGGNVMIYFDDYVYPMESDDAWGTCVAVNGTGTVIGIGGPGADSLNGRAGLVMRYGENPANFYVCSLLEPPAVTDSKEYGTAITFDYYGHTVAVSGLIDNVNYDSGYVNILTGESWLTSTVVTGPTHTLHVPSSTYRINFDNDGLQAKSLIFGGKLFLNRLGTKLAVVDSNETAWDHTGTQKLLAGGVYLYEYTDSWAFERRLSRNTAGDNFGLGASFDNTLTIMNVTINGDSEKVLIKYFGKDFSETKRLLHGDFPQISTDDGLLSSCSYNGNLVSIGFISDSILYGNSGAVFVINTDDWSEVQSVKNMLIATTTSSQLIEST